MRACGVVTVDLLLEQMGFSRLGMYGFGMVKYALLYRNIHDKV
ncbi:hypothetical protein ISN45_At03g030330 [Arabidopsis thaliana x Arabidopsis arenosa]|uniref:Uncharacterized protein n=2 Tax=Arabidopsis TaxID=3701 RepID=A0A8T2F9D2_ARASU|nr:hypothetical protein ISN45_At03g030330 [Arabidopsis thaliana x Arabidopsis arenosa]KAG7632895.1 hypothetical protein ISN44_As03g029880 [Arabidopsis suecica]